MSNRQRPVPSHSILLGNGKWLNVLSPDPDCFDPPTIAHSLSCIPRFCGHLDQRDFVWSVAAHTILVAKLVPPEAKLLALLHDAPEIVISDIPNPVKQLMPGIDRIERQLLLAVCQRFGLSEDDINAHWPAVKAADEQCLVWEQVEFQRGLGEWYNMDLEPPDPDWWDLADRKVAYSTLRHLLEQYWPGDASKRKPDSVEQPGS